MIGTMVRVARGEGWRSLLLRIGERTAEASLHALHRARGAWAHRPPAPLVNVIGTRYGGVAVQFRARMAEERRLRQVAVLDRGILSVDARAWPVRSLAAAGARTVIAEGAFDGIAPLPEDLDCVVSIHDFSLMSSNPQEMEPDAARISATARLFARAKAVLFPSAFLRDAYREVVPRFEGHVIETGILGTPVHADPLRHRIAFCGAVQPHKGGALLAAIIRATPGAEWHIFGGGDVELLRPLRRIARVHGYYRPGALPRLLAKHRIGLAVLPSLFLETFSAALSECWSAGVPAVAFDRGALGARIRAHGGGFLVPPAAGAEGIALRVREWLGGATTAVPAHVTTAREAAEQHVALYRSLGVLP